MTLEAIRKGGVLAVTVIVAFGMMAVPAAAGSDDGLSINPTEDDEDNPIEGIVDGVVVDVDADRDQVGLNVSTGIGEGPIAVDDSGSRDPGLGGLDVSVGPQGGPAGETGSEGDLGLGADVGPLGVNVSGNNSVSLTDQESSVGGATNISLAGQKVGGGFSCELPPEGASNPCNTTTESPGGGGSPLPGDEVPGLPDIGGDNPLPIGSLPGLPGLGA
jgi:hypothetical protein